MKRILAMLLALVMAFSLVACGNQKDTPNDNDSTNDQQATTNPITLRICMSEVQTDTKCVIVKEVTDRITERTDGRVKFDLYYSDALGSIGEVMEQMSLGGNIMGCTSGEQWAAYGCPDMTALNLMYVFPSTDAIMKFNDSDVFHEMTAQLADNGITMFCMNWASAPRVVMATKPINSVDDLNNLILRVPSTPYAAFFEAMGAATTSMAFSEIYNAMQSDIVEACEAPLSTLYGYSIQEVAKYIFMSEHSYASGCFGMATAIWNQISAEDQAIIVEEFSEGGKTFSEQSLAANADFIAKMEDAGVTIVYPSDSDKAAMSAASAKSFEAFPELSEGLLERIQATF